jgi:hypothetical protein
MKKKFIKAIQKYFMKTKDEQKFHIAVYIANAALLVSGITIHSLLGLSIDKHPIVSKPNSIINIWPTVEFIIIDLKPISPNIRKSLASLSSLCSNKIH